MRSIVYVDGFNLYYGAIKHSAYKCKWLNLEAFFRRLRPDDLQELFYFTAKVEGAAGERQQALLDALETLPKTKVVLGKFKPRTKTCRVRSCAHIGDRTYPTYEEKQTDVAIGVQMLDDAYRNRCDRMVIVSGDTDLLPAIRLVKSRFSDKQIIVYVPALDSKRGAAVELRQAVDKARTLPLDLLRHSQFPITVETANGNVSKPPNW